MKPLVILCGLLLSSVAAFATSNHEYGADEYVTIARGLSPDGKYAITTHGGSEDLGYAGFHLYLTNAITGKKIGPLEEIVQILDTGADAYCAQWSKGSQRVTIVYRVSRHEPLKAMSYRIGDGRAYPLSHAPVDATDEQTGYWGNQCSNSQSSPKVYGTPKPHRDDADQ